MIIKLDRRSFLRLAGGTAGGIAAAGVLGSLPCAGVPDGGIRVVPVSCNTNCGGRCKLNAHVKDGRVIRITTDESPDTAERPQLRACLKGRAQRNAKNALQVR